MTYLDLETRRIIPLVLSHRVGRGTEMLMDNEEISGKFVSSIKLCWLYFASVSVAQSKKLRPHHSAVVVVDV